MVEYIVKSAGTKGGLEIWTIVELQGEIEVRSRNQTNFDGKYFGDLHYDGNGKPVLILGIGYQSHPNICTKIV